MQNVNPLFSFLYLTAITLSLAASIALAIFIIMSKSYKRSPGVWSVLWMTFCDGCCKCAMLVSASVIMPILDPDDNPGAVDHVHTNCIISAWVQTFFFLASAGWYATIAGTVALTLYGMPSKRIRKQRKFAHLFVWVSSMVFTGLMYDQYGLTVDGLCFVRDSMRARYALFAPLAAYQIFALSVLLFASLQARRVLVGTHRKSLLRTVSLLGVFFISWSWFVVREVAPAEITSLNWLRWTSLLMLGVSGVLCFVHWITTPYFARVCCPRAFRELGRNTLYSYASTAATDTDTLATHTAKYSRSMTAYHRLMDTVPEDDDHANLPRRSKSQKHDTNYVGEPVPQNAYSLQTNEVLNAAGKGLYAAIYNNHAEAPEEDDYLDEGLSESQAHLNMQLRRAMRQRQMQASRLMFSFFVEQQAFAMRVAIVELSDGRSTEKVIVWCCADDFLQHQLELEAQGYVHLSTAVRALPNDAACLGYLFHYDKPNNQGTEAKVEDSIGIAFGVSIRGVVLCVKQLCFVCGNMGDLLCSSCKGTVYCSQDCQRIHWKEHRQRCGIGGVANGVQVHARTQPHQPAR